jgi:ubiquinone/menaquinone biosynthesis C-methylase UbiE
MKPFRYHSLPTYTEVASVLGRPAVLLDVGCSEGFFLGEVQGATLRVGIDRDRERLAQGKRDRPELAWIRADATALPFTPGTFDGVVSIGVLPYMSDAIAALAEMARVLAPQGRLVLTSLSDHPVYRLLAVQWRRHGVRHLDRQHLEGWVRGTGLRVVASYEKGRLIAPLLGCFYSLVSLIDRRVLRVPTVVGPLGQWARAVTGPLIHWEYRALSGSGNTIYLVAERP